MFAKQTIASASLVVAILGGSAPAYAEPEPPPRDADEAHPDHPPPKKAATGSLSIGAGYNIDDHFVLRASIAQSNLFGTGHLLAMDALISSRRELFRLRYADPHLFDTDYTLAADTYFDRRVLPGFTRRAVGASTTLSHALGDHVRAFATYRVEDVAIEGDTTIYRVADGERPPWLGGVIASLRSGIVYSTLDAPMLPRRGTTAGFAVESASPLFGSTLELARVDGFASTNQPIGSLILHVGGAFHAVTTPGQLVPMSERLYLDGSSELRGYAPGAIMAGGGTYAALGRLSLEMPFVRSVGLSIEGFADAAGMWNERRYGEYGASFGFGLIWRSPLGPLRFDYAFPLVGPPRFVFGAGAFL